MVHHGGNEAGYRSDRVWLAEHGGSTNMSDPVEEVGFDPMLSFFREEGR